MNTAQIKKWLAEKTNKSLIEMLADAGVKDAKGKKDDLIKQILKTIDEKDLAAMAAEEAEEEEAEDKRSLWSKITGDRTIGEIGKGALKLGLKTALIVGIGYAAGKAGGASTVETGDMSDEDTVTDAEM